MRRPLWLLFAIVLFVRSSHAQTGHSRLPGDESEIPSPDGKFVIRNVDGPGQLDHRLFLEEKSTGAKREVYSYMRSVAVVWSPDSRHFAVNDYQVSNIAEAYILGVRDSDGKIDLKKEALSKMESYGKLEWDHGYAGVFKVAG